MTPVDEHEGLPVTVTDADDPRESLVHLRRVDQRELRVWFRGPIPDALQHDGRRFIMIGGHDVNGQTATYFHEAPDL